MFQLKKGLCTLVIALVACTSIFLLSSGSVHAANLSRANPHPFASGGGCNSDNYLEVCNNLDSSGNLIVHWKVLSVPSNCAYPYGVYIGMYGSIRLGPWQEGCAVATYVDNLGYVSTGHAYQAWIKMDFSGGGYVQVGAPIQYT